MAGAGGTIARLSQGTRRSNSSTIDLASPSPARNLGHEQNLTSSSFDPDYESTQHIDQGADKLPSPDDTVSIEMGRGARPTSIRRHGQPHYAQWADEESLYDMTGLTINSEPTTTTPRYKKPAGLMGKPSAKRSTTMPTSNGKPRPGQQDNVKLRSTSANARRDVSHMQAKLNAEFESSFIEQATHQINAIRKPALDLHITPRRPQTRHSVPTRFTTTGGLEGKTDELQRPQPRAQEQHTANLTSQSFMLPDLPNIAELVSGTRKDGTPVFSRMSKGRSRFTSATYEKQENLTITDHAKIVTIPLPEEEKAILASLQVLKDRVAHLEAENTRANNAVDQYANDNAMLRSQLGSARAKRPVDGQAPCDSDNLSDVRAALKVAQDQLARKEQKGAQSRTDNSRLLSERDGLVTQLGVAFYTNEELKSNNAGLVNECDRLSNLLEEAQHDKSDLQNELQDVQTRLEQTMASYDKLNRQWTKREAELKKRIARRDQTIAKMNKVGAAVSDEEEAGDDRGDDRIGHMTIVERQVRKAQRQAARREHGSRQAKDRPSKSQSQSRSRSRSANQMEKQTVDRVSMAAATVETSSEDSASDVDSVVVDLDLHKTRASQRPVTKTAAAQYAKSAHQDMTFEAADAQDLTYLSFLDPNELSRLRRQLEEERKAAKAQSKNTSSSASKDLDTPRKSSLKDLDKALKGDEAINLNALRNVRIISPHTSDGISIRDQEDAGSSTRASGLNEIEPEFEEMTSEFIIPDVNLHPEPKAAATTSDASKTADAASVNATSTPNNPTPIIPISERIRQGPDMDSTTLTVRPSHPPKQALASVIATLEREIQDSKNRLAALEEEYNSLDPAVGKRRRNGLKSSIDELLTQVEARSEVVYRLYDVVEGV